MTDLVWLIAYLGLSLSVAIRFVLCDSRPACVLARLVLFFALTIGSLLAIGVGEQLWGFPSVSVSNALAVLFPLSAVLWLGARRFQSEEDVGKPGGGLPLPTSSIARLTTVLIIGLFAVICLLLLSGLPRGWEVRAYHLPIAVEIFREGSFDLWDPSYPHAYPANMAVWAGMIMQALPERLVSVLNLPFLFLAAAATYCLARAADVDKSMSLLCAAGLTTIPIFGFSGVEIGADVAGAAMLATASYFVLVRPRSFPPWPVLAGLAAGLAFGFKSLHLIGIALLGLVLLYDALTGRIASPRSTLLQRLQPVVVYGLFALGMAGLWLLRNYLATSNPLYPVHIAGLFDVLGWPKAPDIDFSDRLNTQNEFVVKSWQWLIYPWIESDARDIRFRHGAGLGAFFAMMVPMGVVIGAILLFAKQAAVAAPSLAILRRLLFLAVMILLIWWLLGDRQIRYAMGALPLVLPVCGWVASQVVPPLRKSYEALAALAILVMGRYFGSGSRNREGF